LFEGGAVTTLERYRRALQDIAGGNIPRQDMAREPDEPLARWQERNAYTLLAWMQETARRALENDDSR
jgi:hypothetical protein